VIIKSYMNSLLKQSKLQRKLAILTKFLNTNVNIRNEVHTYFKAEEKGWRGGNL